MGLFDTDSDDTSIMGRLRLEQSGMGRVTDLPTGGSVVERYSSGGMSDYSRHDALGTKIDEDRGFSPRW